MFKKVYNYLFAETPYYKNLEQLQVAFDNVKDVICSENINAIQRINLIKTMKEINQSARLLGFKDIQMLSLLKISYAYTMIKHDSINYDKELFINLSLDYAAKLEKLATQLNNVHFLNKAKIAMAYNLSKKADGVMHAHLILSEMIKDTNIPQSYRDEAQKLLDSFIQK